VVGLRLNSVPTQPLLVGSGVATTHTSNVVRNGYKKCLHPCLFQETRKQCMTEIMIIII